MNSWNCDVCGVRTYVNPETKPKMKQEGMKKGPEPDKDGKPQVVMVKGKPQVKMMEVPNMVPVMKTMYQQNLQTGEVKEVQVPDVEFLQTPAVIVRLRVGAQEAFQRDFCPDCLEKYCGDEIRALRDKLMKIEGK